MEYTERELFANANLNAVIAAIERDYPGRRIARTTVQSVPEDANKPVLYRTGLTGSRVVWTELHADGVIKHQP
jgi:hypothetical protein